MSEENRVFRCGVIGCGTISVMHLDSLAALEETDLVAVCDIREDRVNKAAEKYGATAYTDYKKMIAKENLDAVHICLPHYLHIPVTQYALKQGVYVLSEKPMSIGLSEAEETVELADKLNMQYGVIFQCRYNTPSQLVKKRLEEGKLGAIKSARVVLTWSRSDEYYSHSDWKGTWDKEGGGVIIDQAIHSLDLANWFINSTPVKVESTLHNRRHKAVCVEDTAEGAVYYENGTVLCFYTMNNYAIDEPIEIRLACEKGTVRLSYNDTIISYNDGTTEQEVNRPQEFVAYSGGKPYWGTQHAMQIHHFYESLAGNEPLFLSGREALKIQKIICDIYKNNDNPF